MSAYIVNNQTITQLVSFVTTAGGHVDFSWACRRFLEAAAPIVATKNQPPSPAQLGAALYALNVAAVSQRYPGESVETLPGPVVKGYVYRPQMPPAPIQAYKHLHWLLYQYSEGDVPGTPLYQALSALGDGLAHGIVERLPAYDAAR